MRQTREGGVFPHRRISGLADTAPCDTCAIRHRAVCGALNKAELADLNRIARRKTVPAGRVIMSDEEPADFFANIVSGLVKLSKTLPDGRQQIVGLLFPTDFLGRAYAENNPYLAEAATETELCCFPHARFEALLKRHPDLERRLFERTLDELDGAREWMVLLGRKTAAEKVASFLLMVARRSAAVGCVHPEQAGPETVFELPLTRADIGGYLGLTIETVSRQMTKLKMGDIIRLSDNRHFSVPSLDALADVAGQDAQ